MHGQPVIKTNNLCPIFYGIALHKIIYHFHRLESLDLKLYMCLVFIPSISYPIRLH